MKKIIIIHPFLFGLYSVLFLFAANVDRVPFHKTYPVALSLIVGTALIFCLFYAITRNWCRAGLLSTLTVVQFNFFGTFYRLLSGKQIFGLPIGQANVLAALWAAIYLLVGWWILRKLAILRSMNVLLNVISIILCSFPILQVGLYVLKDPQIIRPDPRLEIHKSYSPSNSKRPPDIYYIVLDEYGRSDVLNEVISVDNTDFIRYLKNKGFYVADNSHSNYMITLLSLSSSLNYQYLNEEMRNVVKAKADDAAYIMNTIRHSNARTFLEQAGYRVISYETGYSFSEMEDADTFLQPDHYLDDFDLEYFNNTILVLTSETVLSYQVRNLTLFIFHSLPNLSADEPDVPKFVFVHIPAAHVPFVFGPNGESIHPWLFMDPSNPSGTGTISYTEAYKNQAAFIDKEVEQTIGAILAKSKTKPVIILQSDHGPESQLDWYSVANSCVKERLSILNAYYFPDGDYHELYPSITPVNTFRVVFDTYLGTHLDLVDDKSYFSIWDHPYDFIDVTDKLDAACKPKKIFLFTTAVSRSY